MTQSLIPANPGQYLIAAHSHYDANLHPGEPPVMDIKLVPIVAWSLEGSSPTPITSEGTSKTDGSLSIFDDSGQETELQIHRTLQYDKNIDQVFEFGGGRVLGTITQYQRWIEKELNKAVTNWIDEHRR